VDDASHTVDQSSLKTPCQIILEEKGLKDAIFDPFKSDFEDSHHQSDQFQFDLNEIYLY
jgi:hypothetical protein